MATQEIASREVLIGVVARFRTPAEGSAVEFVDVSVTLAPVTTGAATAEVYLTTKVSETNERTSETSVNAREANVAMARLDGKWVITSIQSAETLQRP